MFDALEKVFARGPGAEQRPTANTALLADRKDRAACCRAEGNAQQVSGELLGEERLYADIVALDPDDAPSHVNLGYVRLERGLHSLALESSLRAAAMDPSLADVDLVVTVDTSVAHLAGALARPLWILLPHQPDWRWLLRREDSPWYPTCRLSGKLPPGRWDEALLQLRVALEAWRARPWARTHSSAPAR